MERYISEEERIKKAEEISARRRNRIPVSNININKKRKMPFLSKIFIQVVCSICIFGMFYFINQNNSMAMEKIKPILSEDTDFVKIYNQINDFFKNLFEKINKNEDQNNISEEQTNESIENLTDEAGNNEIINDETVNDENTNNEGNGEEDNGENNEVDGEENNNENKEIDNSENIAGVGGSEEVNLSETDQDIIYIKDNENFIKPVNGWITSGYGEREATEIISANHAGVDIGANTGTEIIASMSGVVELVSSEGDYGNHLVITDGEVSTLYAHCSQIVVNQGDYINQGQKIAEVGSTGRTTGPHLHFEIRRNNKTVDPQKILDL